VKNEVVDPLSDAITAYGQRRTAFLDFADRFQKSIDPAVTRRVKSLFLHVLGPNRYPQSS